jgi:hypothetical protein
MKTPTTPQGFIDETVEHILTGKLVSYGHDWLIPQADCNPAAIARLEGDSLHYPAKKTVSRRWLEEAFVQKRNDGRRYFSSPPEMVLADLLELPGVTEIGEGTEDKILALEQKISFLETQLEAHRPYLQLYRLGAGSLFVAALSIAMWLFAGVGIPLHPIFAVGVIPAALGVIAMAFLIRPAGKPER